MNAHTQSAASNTLTVVGSPADPVPRLPKGRSFAEVYQDVMQRSGEMLPDQVVHVADLRMTPDGNITLPGALCYRINDHAKRQLSALLGIVRSQCHGV